MARVLVGDDYSRVVDNERNPFVTHEYALYQGLRKLIGGVLVRFYDPRTADCLDKSNDCVVM